MSARFWPTHQPIKNIQIIQLLEPTLPCWNIFIPVQKMKGMKHVLCLCLYPIICCPSTLICRYNLAEFVVSFCPSTSIIWKVFSGRPLCWCLIQLNEQVNLLQKKDKNIFFTKSLGLIWRQEQKSLLNWARLCLRRAISRQPKQDWRNKKAEIKKLRYKSSTHTSKEL